MVKIPKQVYVVAKKNSEIDYSTGQTITSSKPFGFLNAYEPRKATWQKKLDTQMNWAYDGRGTEIEMRNGILYEVGDLYVYDNILHRWVTQPVDQPVFFQPVIWDNNPVTGFKILNSVNRYSTSNKLWRVEDPRGVEFEISTLNFENIVMASDILKGGHIVEPCVWIGNKNLMVVS